MKFFVIQFWARSEIVLVRLWYLAWSGHWLLVRLMDLGLINQRYHLILVKKCRRMNLWSDRESDWRRSNWNRCFDGIWRKLKALVWSAI